MLNTISIFKILYHIHDFAKFEINEDVKKAVLICYVKATMTWEFYSKLNIKCILDIAKIFPSNISELFIQTSWFINSLNILNLMSKLTNLK